MRIRTRFFLKKEENRTDFITLFRVLKPVLFFKKVQRKKVMSLNNDKFGEFNKFDENEVITKFFLKLTDKFQGEHIDVVDAFIQVMFGESTNADKAIVETFQNACKDEHVRRAIISIALDDTNPLFWLVRVTAILALQNASEHEEVREALISTLVDGDRPNLRSNAAKALQNAWKHEDVRQVLIAALCDPYDYVQEAAVKALRNACEYDDVRKAIIAAIGVGELDVREIVRPLQDASDKYEDIKEALFAACGDGSL